MRKLIQKFFWPTVRNTIVQHLLFWVVSGYVLLNVFSLSSSFQKIDFIYTAIFMISLAIPVELNLLYFIPKFLNRKKYFAWICLFIGSLLLFSLLNQLLFSHLIDFIFPGYFFISYYSYIDILKFFKIFMAATTLLHLSKEWLELNDTRQKLVLLEKEKSEAELKALSNQVNPHFLFNSLNVLYSLAMNQRDEAPEAILKLSDILRYVIYDSSEENVSIGSEIQLIRDYIDLQKFRTSGNAQISFETDVEDEQMKIAPMLCLPLVENSFKHGLKGDIKDTFVNMRLVSKAGTFSFDVENNKGEAGTIGGKGSGGVGLNNIRNRLELIYPDRHKFRIVETGFTFRVEMEISLQ